MWHWRLPPRLFFPLARNDRGVFADGGLVGTHPTCSGCTKSNTFLAPKQNALVRVLSIGTMTIGATVAAAPASTVASVSGAGAVRSGDFRPGILGGLHAAPVAGEQLLQIDDKATPDQSKDVKALDRVSIGATNTLEGSRQPWRRSALGDPLFQPFRAHQAGAPSSITAPTRMFRGRMLNLSPLFFTTVDDESACMTSWICHLNNVHGSPAPATM